MNIKEFFSNGDNLVLVGCGALAAFCLIAGYQVWRDNNNAEQEYILQIETEKRITTEVERRVAARESELRASIEKEVRETMQKEWDRTTTTVVVTKPDGTKVERVVKTDKGSTSKSTETKEKEVVVKVVKEIEVLEKIAEKIVEKIVEKEKLIETTITYHNDWALSLGVNTLSVKEFVLGKIGQSDGKPWVPNDWGLLAGMERRLFGDVWLTTNAAFSIPLPKLEGIYIGLRLAM
jgi:hypothetical protein